MRRIWRTVLLIGLLTLLTGLTAGCSSDIKMTFDPQELYSLPKLPAKYTELNNQINKILEGGAEYAAPVSGTNIQPVQLWDLMETAGKRHWLFSATQRMKSP